MFLRCTFCSQRESRRRPGPAVEANRSRSPRGQRREAVVPLTCQLFLPFHPSDGGGWLAAHGRAGELRLVPLADHVLAALDDWAAWWHWKAAAIMVREAAVTYEVQIHVSHHQICMRSC